jgi:Glycosyl hydrolase family 20, catalytic domain
VIATCGYYLDKLWPAGDYYRIDPQDPTACGLTREQFAEGLPGAIPAEHQVIDPLLKLSHAQQALVLGGEAALWPELVSKEMLDGRLWPGAAVMAERLWSSASMRDATEMYRQLIVVHDGLRVTGLADDANRRRMAARLAPDESEPVALRSMFVLPLVHFDSLAFPNGGAMVPIPDHLRPPQIAAVNDARVANEVAGKMASRRSVPDLFGSGRGVITSRSERLHWSVLDRQLGRKAQH